MTQEIIDRAKSMLSSGYDLNRVSSILGIDRLSLEKEINKPMVKSTKSKKVDTPLFEDEPGL